jgi:hypothetical protein
MINADSGKVYIEGNLKDLIAEWAHITTGLYKEIAKHDGVETASKVFTQSLKTAATIAVIELKIEEKMDDGEV